MERISPDRQETNDGNQTERTNALSDGVFAIAITLLVLNIEVPRIQADVVAQQLPGELIGLAPDLLSYVISFLVIGSYWMAHRSVFQHIRSLNRTVMWLNILFLMFVAYLPFPTALLDQYPNQRLTVVIYAGSLAVARVPLTAIWWYTTSKNLIHSHLDTRTVMFYRLHGLGIPFIFLLSIGISFVSIWAAIFSWLFLFVIDQVILHVIRPR